MIEDWNLLQIGGFFFAIGGFVLGCITLSNKQIDNVRTSYRDTVADLVKRIDLCEKQAKEDRTKFEAELLRANLAIDEADRRADRYEKAFWELRESITKQPRPRSGPAP